MRSSAPAPTLARRPARVLPYVCALALDLIVGTVTCLPAPAVAADPAGRAYADARRRADLEHSQAERECARLAPTLKEDCEARARIHYSQSLATARERFPDAAAPPPLDPAALAHLERELADCERVAGRERADCRLDVKRRYRH